MTGRGKVYNPEHTRTLLSLSLSKFIISQENKTGSCLPHIWRTNFLAFSSWNLHVNIFVHDNYKPERLCHRRFLCCGFCMLWTRGLNVCSLGHQQQLDLLQHKAISCPDICKVQAPKGFLVPQCDIIRPLRGQVVLKTSLTEPHLYWHITGSAYWSEIWFLIVKMNDIIYNVKQSLGNGIFVISGTQRWATGRKVT